MGVARLSKGQDEHAAGVPAFAPSSMERRDAPDAEGGRQRPVRVLVLIAAGSIDAGPVKGCLQFIRHMRSAALSFHLVNFRVGDDDPGADRFAEAAASAGVPVEFVTQRGRGYAALARDLDAIVAREHIDIIQSHGFKPAALCLWLRLRRGVPWVCFGHGATAENWRVRVYNAVEDIARLFADRVVFVADAQRRGPLGWLTRRRSRVIRNAVDMAAPARCSPSGSLDVRHQLGLESCDRLAVAIGRLSPEKGLDVLIDALALDTDPPNQRLHVAVVGEGPERERLAERVSRLHLGGRVHFVGHCSTPGDWIVAADLVVLPSRSEGIPNVALEAMALGRPLVATAVGGTPEVVPDGTAGMLVPAGNAPALAAAMREVLTDPALARRLGAGACAHAGRELSVETRCSRLYAVYTELMPRLSAATGEQAA